MKEHAVCGCIKVGVRGEVEKRNENVCCEWKVTESELVYLFIVFVFDKVS